MTRLRKNPGANIVHEGPPGILANSTHIHTVRLFKMESHIGLTVDGRRAIDWKEDGGVLGGTYGVGRIALRQMKWSWFRYRNFQFRELTDSRSA